MMNLKQNHYSTEMDETQRGYHPKQTRNCTIVNSLENHADDIFDNAVARLFEDNVSAIEVIKLKEVLSALETATDKCEDAANVMESVIVKFS